MSKYSDRLANFAIAVAALTLTATLIRREVSSRTTELDHSAPPLPEFYSEWRSLDSVSLPLDAADGPIHVYIFSDMECPYCALFHQNVIPSVYERFADGVTVRLVHLPLRSHKFSRQAAGALECAAAQSRATEFLDKAYSKQDSIGLIPWGRFARDAGVPDTAKFETCSLAKPNPRIAAGETISTQLDIRSTPTIIVNGWRFAGIQDSAAFLASLELIKAGADPIVTAKTR